MEPKKTGSSPEDLTALRRLAQREIAALEGRLTSLRSELGGHRVSLVGAMRSGLYFGPKPGRLSLNDDCPFEWVVEFDLRLVLPADRDPHRLAPRIAEAFGAATPPTLTWVRHWDRSHEPSALIYRYEELEAGRGIEWELTVSRGPYVDITHYWSALFSRSEVSWQRRCRKLICAAGAAGAAGYCRLKERQNEEARWRLLLANALAQGVVSTSGPAPPAGALAGEPVTRLARQWPPNRQVGAGRPGPALPPELSAALRMLDEEEAKSLSRPPPPPRWVDGAT